MIDAFTDLGAAAEYRAERDHKAGRLPDPFEARRAEAPRFPSSRPSAPPATPAPVQLEVVSAASLAGTEVPARPWLIPDWIPDRAVTMLGGDGSTGKTLIALQLAVAVAIGSEWLGTVPDTGPVLFLSAEDDLDELHRRLADIVGSQGRSLADLESLHLVPLSGRDAVLGAPAGRAGLIEATPLWTAVRAKIAAIRPRLVIVDNLADAFGGNENIRPEARQFIGILRAAAIEFEHASLLLAHPSLSGLSSGSGTSGSTAWSNSVRSRLYLDRAVSDEGDEPDPDLRVLKLLKANYAAMGAEIRMRWQDGVFHLDGAGVGRFDRIATEARAERVFVELLTTLSAQGRDVSHKRSSSFAPTIFNKQPEARGLSKAVLEAAMDRLFAAGIVRSEETGPVSKRRSRIVLVEATEPAL